jgi:hypothetical protein
MLECGSTITARHVLPSLLTFAAGNQATPAVTPLLLLLLLLLLRPSLLG